MKTDINGTTLAYGDRGKGLPLVLIHGFPLCRKMWRPQAKEGMTDIQKGCCFIAKVISTGSQTSDNVLSLLK